MDINNLYNIFTTLLNILYCYIFFNKYVDASMFNNFDENELYSNVCKKLLPFHLNSFQNSNIFHEIELSNIYTINYNINYLYFDYINENFFIDFYMSSKYPLIEIKLYEQKKLSSENELIFRKNFFQNEVIFFKIIETDNNKSKNEKRKFYFIIEKDSKETECIDVVLNLRIKLLNKIYKENEITNINNYIQHVIKTNNLARLHNLLSNEEYEKHNIVFKHFLPYDDKNFIFIKDDYYHFSENTYIFNLEESENFYIDNEGNKIDIIYSVIFFSNFEEHKIPIFSSFLNEHAINLKGIYIELEQIKISKLYMQNIEIKKILNYINKNYNCTNHCNIGKKINSGLYLYVPLEHGYVYRYQIKFKNEKSYLNKSMKYMSYIFFNMEYSIKFNKDSFSVSDRFIKLVNECIYGSFLPDKIIQLKDSGMLNKFKYNHCYKHQNCKLDDIKNFVISDKVIELNDSFILKVNSVNHQIEQHNIKIIIEETSLFNFFIISKHDNMNVNLYEKEFNKVCNTYYIHHINDYHIYDYIKKESLNFFYEHFYSKLYKNKDHHYKEYNFFFSQNIIYINCVLIEGEYTLNISYNNLSHNCDTNEVTLLIYPIQIYEENHKCETVNETLVNYYEKYLINEYSKSLNNIDTHYHNELLQNVFINEKIWKLNNNDLINYEFISIYENKMLKNIEEIIITVNNSLFLDFFFVIVQRLNEKEYFYIYKITRKKMIYKFNMNSIYDIYILTTNLNYLQKQLCSFYFIIIQFIYKNNINNSNILNEHVSNVIINTNTSNENHTNEINSHQIILNKLLQNNLFNHFNNTFIESINNIPDIIIGTDNYYFANFCYIPSNYKHLLKIYIQENSIIKINCFLENFIDIYLLKDGDKLHEGYNHFFIEAGVSGEYEIMFIFNADKEIYNFNFFFYLQIFIYHLNVLNECIFNEEMIKFMVEKENFNFKNISDDLFDFTKSKNEITKNNFVYESSSNYYYFKRFYMFLDNTVETIIKLPTPKEYHFDLFFLKLELIFHKNIFPYKMVLQDENESFMQYEGNVYRNKIVLYVNNLTNVENKFTLFIDFYDKISSLNKKYCNYVYFTITYTNKIEIYDNVINYIFENYMINLPFLLNNLFIYDIPYENIHTYNNIENNINKDVSNLNVHNHFTLSSQSISYNIEISKNNFSFFYVTDNMFLNILMYNEDKAIDFKLLKCSGIEVNKSIFLDDMNEKNILNMCQIIFDISKEYIYFNIFLEKGIYIFKFNNYIHLLIKIKIIWTENKNDKIQREYFFKEKNEKIEQYDNTKIKPLTYFNKQLLKTEINYFFDSNFKCSKNNGALISFDRNFENYEFIKEQLIKNKFQLIFDNDIEFNGESNNFLYKSFCLTLFNFNKDNYMENKNIEMLHNKENESFFIYTIFKIKINKKIKLYIEIKPHYYFFIYPFHLRLIPNNSFLLLENPNIDYYFLDLEKGEYTLQLFFPYYEKKLYKYLLFDIILISISNKQNEKKLINNFFNKNNNVLNEDIQKQIEETCEINKYKQLFSKINMINIEDNEDNIKKNIFINEHTNEKRLYIFDHFYYINDNINNEKDIFFTINNEVTSDEYYLVIFIQKINHNEYLDPFLKNNQDFNYENFLINFNYNIYLYSDKVDDKNNIHEENKKNEHNESSLILPLYNNVHINKVKAIYKVNKNFKLVLKTKISHCNYLKLIINMIHVKFLTNLLHIQNIFKINDILHEISEIYNGNVIKSNDQIKYQKTTFQNFTYKYLKLDPIYLINHDSTNYFYIHLNIQENSYIKIDAGYNILLSIVQLKLKKENNIVAFSKKDKIYLDNNLINTKENITFYIEKGIYELEIYLYIIDDISQLLKNLFPFFFEIQIFELTEFNENKPLLMDIYPDNSIPIDKNYNFEIDIVIWGILKDQIYLEDSNKNEIKVINNKIIENENIEIHKLILSTDIMNNIKKKFILKFPNNILIVDKLKDKYHFIFNDNISYNVINEENISVNEKAYLETISNNFNENKEILNKKDIFNENINILNENDIHTLIKNEYLKEIKQINFPSKIKYSQNILMNDEQNKEVFLSDQILNGENNCNYSSIFSLKFINCIKRKLLSFFIFILFSFLLTGIFLFFFKLFKYWRDHKNYTLIENVEEEPLSTFVDF